MRHNISKVVVAAAIVVAAGAAPVATAAALPPDCDLLVVRAYYSDRSQLEAVTQWNEPWSVDPERGVMVLGVDGDGFARLVGLGLAIEIDEKATAAACAPRTPLEGQVEGIPGYPCYRTVEETFAAAAAIASDHPDLAEWLDVGDSWEKVTPGGLPGYDLRVLRLTNRSFAGTPTGDTAPHGKPRLLITASIHAREYTPAELATRFAEWLVDGYGTDPEATWLLDEHEISLVLHANPDGRKHAESGLSWRKNTNQAYCGATSTSRGADLNRNFDYVWGCCGGSSSYDCDTTYRGPGPASEPEAQAIQDLMRAVFPDQKGNDASDPVAADATGVYLDLHSSGGWVLWPWGFTYSPAPSGPGLQALGRRLAFFNGYFPDQSVGLYPTDGTTCDFAYGDLGVAGYTIELGTSFFQGCSTFENTILPANLPALAYAAAVARTPYETAGGPVATGVAVTSGTVVAPGDPVTVVALVDDTRFSDENGAEPTQAITAAELSVGAPPWRDPAPASHPMGASDGAFDGPTEAVTTILDTTGLEQGRHMLYVRGRDAAGTWGAVGAAFLWVLDPAGTPHIAGVVRDVSTGDPIEAMISSPPFSTVSDPASGAYDLLVPEGMYDLEVAADGYATALLSGVPATGTSSTVLDVDLAPYSDLLFDDAEAGNVGWSAQSPWAIVASASHSPTHSWTDSPAGSYGNGADTSLTSPVLDLSDATAVSLELWHRYDLETGYDYGRIEVSSDGGSTWTEVASVNGSSGGQWERLVVRMPALDGVAAAHIRFRLDSDFSVVEDGWYLDDIRLRGVDPAGLALVFSDGFESGDSSAWSVASGS